MQSNNGISFRNVFIIVFLILVVLWMFKFLIGIAWKLIMFATAALIIAAVVYVILKLFRN